MNQRHTADFRTFCLIRQGECGDKKAIAMRPGGATRNTCVTNTPNAVVAKGGQMVIRFIDAKLAFQQNIRDWAFGAESKSTSSPMASDCNRSNPADPSRLGFGTRRSLRRWLAAGCLGLAVLGSSGCTITSGLCKSVTETDCIDDFMIGYRNRAMAEKAWHCQKHQLGHHRFGREYKAGFIDGYLEVASGGSGCTPALAPSDYWGWRYQSAQGQAAVNSWFQGF